jgi:hypothetical protein
VPVDQLLRRLHAEEQAVGPLEYARSVVEYCSHVALRVEARRPDHLGDREFHTLTYDMMLAWEAPDEETDAMFQVRSALVFSPLEQTDRVDTESGFIGFFSRRRKRHSAFSVTTRTTTTTVHPFSIQAQRRWPFRSPGCFPCI